MSKSDYLPSNVLKLQSLTHIVHAHAVANQVRWDISASAIAALEGPIKRFDDTLAISENPETRTSAAIRKREEARKALEAELRPFIQGRIYNNRNVTDDDILALGLPLHDRKATQHPDREDTPEFFFSTKAPATLDIGFRAKNTKSQGKPKDVHGVEFRMVLADKAPKDWSELTRSEFTTRSPLKLTFTGEERGKHLYIAARWENNRGGKGPWSEILDTIIP
jgi:hypothetical protein